MRQANTYAPVPRTRQDMDKNTCDKAIRLKADIRHLQKRQQLNFISTNFDGQYIIAKHIFCSTWHQSVIFTWLIIIRALFEPLEDKLRVPKPW